MLACIVDSRSEHGDDDSQLTLYGGQAVPTENIQVTGSGHSQTNAAGAGTRRPEWSMARGRLSDPPASFRPSVVSHDNEGSEGWMFIYN